MIKMRNRMALRNGRVYWTVTVVILCRTEVFSLICDSLTFFPVLNIINWNYYGLLLQLIGR